MRNDHHLALGLRKKGLSYKEISEELNVPRSTLNYWFKDLAWSKDIKERLTEKAIRVSRKRIRRVIKSNRERWEKRREGARNEAENDFIKLKTKSLFVSGIMLYWGEGDQKLKYPVRLTNIDYRMIVLFKKFLLEICKIEKEDIYLSLFIYPDLLEESCKKFWSDKIGIKLEQFEKVQVIYGKHPTKRLENGICSIRVRKSTGLKEKILVWINLLSKSLEENNKMRV
ncbi:MAG: helix-turn-helix domain-containing protein [Candidatus Pacebacteria bacterium]|nr:helix-turn-helix domain-containing protein [Candidatus Paceibacterota bacterium]